ncbi:hypothetical protein Pmani_000967 [Petrolisthes manimaculis]|uniref:RNA-directed DNA polymerase n=2 Tax=Petrolisthes manimaculis TaxID=1843537 RepID=A0AAE1QKN5_9EUCA|nr:hypothetical protein Pmani_000967 [Petrolisthes manimaculis]
MPLYGTLEQFNEGNGTTWEEYCERMEQYFLANAVTEVAVKRAIFLSSVGASTYSKLRSLCSPSKPKDKSFDALIALLNSYFDPKPSVILARFRFNSCYMKEGEKIKDFVAKLRKLSEHCNYGLMLNELLRDRLVCGVINKKIQSRLLSEVDLTLDKAVELAVAMETAACDTEELQQPNVSVETSRVHRVYWPQHRNTSSAPGTSASRQPVKCFRCLSRRHASKDCPFRNKACFDCQKLGHTRAAHRAGTVNNVEVTEKSVEMESGVATSEFGVSHSSETNCDTVYSLFKVDSNQNEICHVTPVRVKLRINGLDTQMEVDTGASVSVMSEEEFKKLDGCTASLRPSLREFRTYTGENIAVLGVTDVKVWIANHEELNLPLIVAKGQGPGLLGRNWMARIRLDWPTILGKLKVNVVRAEEEFSEVFSEELGCFTGGKARLLIDDSVKPKFYKARPVPLALQKKVDEELDRLEAIGVIKTVKHSDWAAPIVVVPKPSGSVRICGDFKLTVNTVAALEQYPLPRTDELFALLSGCSVFSKLDMSHAYNQIELEEESQRYVVINTTKGLKQYTRLAFGIHSAVAIFQRMLSNLLAGLPHVTVFLDDVVVGGVTEAEHDSTLREVLRRMSASGLRLNRAKCQLRLPEVTYLGHRVSSKGVEPTDDKTQAIVQAPAPTDVKSLRAWLGLINYYSRFLKNLASILSPLYKLLKDGQEWEWNREQSEAFQAAKKLLLKSNCLAHFDISKETVLACDASPYGLGCVLSQIDDKGVERPVAFYSRKLNETEQRYAQIDREGLSIISGVKKWHYYLYGRPFVIVTDHKPLLGLLGEDKPLPVNASPRVQRWALMLSAYTYKLVYSPGRYQTHCDGLSRLPLPHSPTKVPAPTETVHLMEFLNEGPVTQEQIRKWTGRDPVLSAVREYVRWGWPDDLSDKSPGFLSYKNRMSELSIHEECLMWGCRVIIPPQGRQAVLKEVHEGHFGASRMKNRARSYFWWPGLDKELEEVAATCSVCQESRGSAPPADLQPWTWPSQPWRRLHLDYCGPFEGFMWLLIVDAHSKWLDVHKTTTTSAEVTIECCRKSMASFGIPDYVVTDNATCFTCPAFKEFCKKNGIRHLTSPPWSPKSNGLVERAVQTFKTGLRKQRNGSLSTKVSRFLFNYRAVPHSVTGVSPAEMMFSRPMRTSLDLLKQDIRQNRMDNYQRSQKEWYDRQSRPRSFQVGDKVYVYSLPKTGQRSNWLPGVITSGQGTSYEVTLEDGRTFRRHVDHLRFRQVASGDMTTTACVPQVSKGSAVTSMPTFDMPEPKSQTPEQQTEQQTEQTAVSLEEGRPSTSLPPFTGLSPSASDAAAPPSVPTQVDLPQSSPVPELRRSSRVSVKPDRYGYM